MKLLVISHKETWVDPVSPTGYGTIGGFPFQIKALSELFDETRVAVPVRNPPAPEGMTALDGHHLSVIQLAEPAGNTITRKITIWFWLIRHLALLWKSVKASDVIHIPIPGDIGTIGLMIALLQHKHLFVRHCGRWGVPSSFVDQFLQWFLVKIASKKNVVWATGGGFDPPSEANENIRWIFATSLEKHELDNLTPATAWQPGQILRLITIGGLRPGKNISAAISSLPLIKKTCENVSLDILGDGELHENLNALVERLNCADIVTFHGNVEHKTVLELLSRSHLFVFPTLREGFPKALLEAMACGLPVIANPVSVIPYLVEKNQCGLLLKKPDAESIAAAVLQMIADHQRMKQMGENAHAAAETYTLENWRDLIREELEYAWCIQLRS